MNDELKDNNINKQTKEAKISVEDTDKNVRKEKMSVNWGKSSQIMWLLITFPSLVFNTIMVKVNLVWKQMTKGEKNKENLPLPLHSPRLPTKHCSVPPITSLKGKLVWSQA